MPQRDNLDRDCLIEMFAMDLRASGLEKEAEAFEISCLVLPKGVSVLAILEQHLSGIA